VFETQSVVSNQLFAFSRLAVLVSALRCPPLAAAKAIVPVVETTLPPRAAGK
jgi:hypothetical protein